MRNELIEILCCPKTGSRLALKDAVYRGGKVYSGKLVSESELECYLIHNFIPRFVPQSNYADNFGMQWNRFRRTQLDSHSGYPISSRRFWLATGWDARDIRGKWVLDVGCGAGRFAEIALQAGANVVALDYSRAVDACYSNLGHYSNLHVVQGDIYSLPFRHEIFSYVYSLGVLQHTPDVAKAFASLPPMVAKGGQLCTDFYWKRLRTLLHMKYLLRPLTKHIPQDILFRCLEKSVPRLLRISQILGHVPFFGKGLKRIIPVADYTGIYPLDQSQLEEWALLDTFDMLGPRYDNPQTAATIRCWMENAGMVNIDVFQVNLLVARGEKPSGSKKYIHEETIG